MRKKNIFHSLLVKNLALGFRSVASEFWLHYFIAGDLLPASLPAKWNSNKICLLQ